jgi:hypothetical protein
MTSSKKLIIILLIITMFPGCKSFNNEKKISWTEKKFEDNLNALSYPQINHTDKSIEKKINTTIIEVLDEMKVIENDEITEFTIGNYKITYNTNNMLSIIFNIRYRIEGSLSYMDYIASLNFNLETGKTLSLKELFNDNYDYLAIINNFIEEYFNTNNIDETFIGIEDEYLFYLTKNGLSIYFPPSQYTSASSTPLVININNNKFDENFILNK